MGGSSEREGLERRRRREREVRGGRMRI